MTKKESKIVFVKKSKYGKGIFAKKNISDSEIIIRIKGKLITCAEDDNLDEQTRSNTIRFNSEMFISPKNELGNFVNHSCNPNCRIIKKDNKLFLMALYPIKKGKEITFDYSTVLASDDIWEMKCKCGEKDCRKIIKKFYSLKKKTKQYYIDKKIVPRYILAIK